MVAGDIVSHPALALARRLAAAFADVRDVEAVALGGSHANLVADAGSDIDLSHW